METCYKPEDLPKFPDIGRRSLLHMHGGRRVYLRGSHPFLSSG